MSRTPQNYLHINRKVQGHVCSLPTEEDTVVKYIFSGIFVDSRRKFRQYLMIDASDPEVKKRFKSTAQIRFEEEKHLGHYYHTIHPFSRARFHWERLMTFVYLIIFLIIPLELSVMGQILNKPYVCFRLCLDVISWTDILLFFLTGYYNKTSQKLELRPRNIIRHYLFTYCIFDVASCLPFTYINYWLNAQHGYVLIYINLILVIKIVRIGTFFDYVKKLARQIGCWNYNVKLIISFITLVLVIEWATALHHLSNVFTIGVNIVQHELFDIVKSAHQTVIYFFLVGLTNEPSMKTGLLEIACLLIGCVFSMVLLAEAIQIYQRQSSSNHRYHKLVQQIEEYIKYKEFPKNLRDRVFQYVNFKFQKHVYKEAEMLNTLSSILQQASPPLESGWQPFLRVESGGLLLVYEFRKFISREPIPYKLADQRFHNKGLNPRPAFDIAHYNIVTIATSFGCYGNENVAMEILLHNSKSLMEKVDLFKDLPMPLLLRMISKLHTEIYLPNDIIVHAGIGGHSMYFICVGTVVVYTASGKEICHLHDGSYFGEIALVINEPRVATVVAIRECEIFRLSRKDFQEAIHPYPEFRNKIRKSALTRLETTMQITHQE